MPYWYFAFTLLLDTVEETLVLVEPDVLVRDDGVGGDVLGVLEEGVRVPDLVKPLHGEDPFGENCFLFLGNYGVLTFPHLYSWVRLEGSLSLLSLHCWLKKMSQE